MRVAVACGLALWLAGCATPQPVVDTASRVAAMSDAMDRSVTNYIDSLKSVRQLDEQRLRELREDARRRKVPIQDQLQILAVAEDDKPVKAMNDLAVPTAADPLGPDGGLAAPVADVKFDDAPLKSVTTIARDIATPVTAADQLRVLAGFAKTVNADLQKAADSNRSAGGAAPKP